DGSVSQQRWINGEPVMQVFPMAEPEEIELTPSANVAIDDCDNAIDGCYAWSVSSWTAQYLIEPSPGEVDGQPVAFCAVWSGEVSAHADLDSSAGAIAGGDDSSLTDPPVVPVELFPEAASVVINGGEEEYFFGPLSVSAPPATADASEVRRVILARIGDTIDV